VANKIGTLNVTLTATAGGLTRALTGASKRLKSFAGSVTRVGAKVAGFGSLAVGAVGFGGVSLAVRKSFADIDKLAKTSDKLGVPTEKLAGLRHAAELTGAGTKALDMGLQRMTRRLADAAVKGGPLADELNRLGLDISELSTMRADQQFSMIADAFKGIGTQSERVRVAFKLFDSEGVNLVNTLAAGSDGLAEMQTEAEKLGIAMNRTDAAKIEAANDAITKLQSAFMGAANAISVELAPYIEALVTRITALAVSGDGMRERIVGAFSTVITAASKVADIVHVLKMGWKLMQIGASGAILAVVSGINGLIEGVSWLAEKVWGADWGTPQFLKDFEAGLEHTLHKFSNEMDQLARADWPSQSAEQFLRDIERASTQAAEKVSEARQQILDEFTTAKPVAMDAKSPAKTTKSPSNVQTDALIRGSSEAYNAIVRAFTQSSHEDLDQKQLNESQKQTRLLETIAASGGLALSVV
jgi:hypothetical protein